MYVYNIFLLLAYLYLYNICVFSIYVIGVYCICVYVCVWSCIIELYPFSGLMELQSPKPAGNLLNNFTTIYLGFSVALFFFCNFFGFFFMARLFGRCCCCPSVTHNIFINLINKKYYH